jgi:hypothetical protein
VQLREVKRVFKLLKIVLLSIILLLSFSVLGTAAEKPDVKFILNYAKNSEIGKYRDFSVFRWEEPYLDNIITKVTMFLFDESDLNTSYIQSWKVRAIIINHYVAQNYFLLTVIHRNYRDFVSPRSQGYVEWRMYDIDANGIITNIEASYASKNYDIVICKNNDDSCKDNYILFPVYPEGYVNSNWYHLTTKECQELYDKEINYWLKAIQKQKKR